MSKILEDLQTLYDNECLPTACVGEDIFTYVPGSGWIGGLKVFEDLMLHQTGKLPDKANQMRKIRFSLPLGSALFEGVHYFEWDYNESYWAGQWKPAYITRSTLVFEDCLIDLGKGTLTQRDQMRRPIWGPILTLRYQPDATHPDWEEVLDKFLRHDMDLHDYVQEAASLLLLPHHFAKSFLLFVGPSNTGKSTLMSALAVAPGGLPGQTSLDPVVAAGNRFESFALLNRFAAVCEELETLTPRAKAWLKSYTGGRFSWEVKYGTRGSSSPTAKMLAASNALPDFVEDGKAVHNRMVVIPMMKEVEGLQNSDFCTSMFWAKPERRAAVVAWMLPGLVRLINRGFRLVPPKNAEQVKEEIRIRTHPVYRWFEETLIVTEADDDRITTVDIMERLKHSGIRDIGVRRLTDLLMTWNPRIKQTKKAKVDRSGKWIDGRGFQGLKVLE